MSEKLLEWFEKRRKTKTLEIAHRQIIKSINTVIELKKAITAFSIGNKAEVEKCIERLFSEEEEIDDLRRSVFEQLARGDFPPKYREDLMHLVKRLDVMADYVKDSARSVKVLMGTSVPKEILRSYVVMAGDLVESAVALRKSIEKLGSNPSEARELSLKVDMVEARIDKEYLETKSLFIKYSKEVDSATLMMLKDLVEFMEHAADMCADTSDYIKLLAASEEK